MKDSDAFSRILDIVYEARCQVLKFSVSNALDLQKVIEQLEEAESLAWHAEKRAQVIENAREEEVLCQ